MHFCEEKQKAFLLFCSLCYQTPKMKFKKKKKHKEKEVNLISVWEFYIWGHVHGFDIDIQDFKLLLVHACRDLH